MPRNAIAPLIADPAPHLVRPFGAEAGTLRLVMGYVESLLSAETLAPEGERMAASHVYDLAALLIGATRDAAGVAQERGLRAARLRAVKADILQNLGDCNLSAALVAARQRITPRYVQMLLEAEGLTFSAFVLSERLGRAHRMLIDPRLAARSVSEIAFAVGFGDLSYFNRCFRRRFGDTPSAVRAEAKQSGAGPIEIPTRIASRGQRSSLPRA